VKWPCFYGIDFATRVELIATGLGVDEICRSIGADSLGYVSLEQLVEATTVPMGALCRACFDGVYPVRVPDRALVRAPEQAQLPLDEEAALLDAQDGLASLLGGTGAADALTRP
jgi:amidophosphoribosyltransferase